MRLKAALSDLVFVLPAVVFNNVSHVWIGAYLFEVLQSLGFEWSVITGRRKFTLPMLVRDFARAGVSACHSPEWPNSCTSTRGGCCLRPLWACKRGLATKGKGPSLTLLFAG